jgi:hypothetical protein
MKTRDAPRGGTPRWSALPLAAILAAAAPSLFAQDAGDGYDFAGGYVEGSGPGRALIGLGAFNAFNRDNADVDVKNDEPSFEARAEYQWGRKWYGLGPVAGFLGNFDGGLFGYGGLYLDFVPTPGWVITPMGGAGAYSRGDSKELGGTFNFILQLDVARQFGNASRLGVRLTHLSSAGINDPNPGVNSLLVIWSFPFDL